MEKIQANIVIEMMGKPADHVKASLNALVTQLGGEKGVKIKEKSLHDPLPVEKTNDLFTAFAEVMLEVESWENYFGIVFAYMPSHSEIIHPEKVVLSNHELNDIGNKIVSRLHEYDAVTKRVLMDQERLLQQLRKYAPHLFKKKPSSTQEKSASKKEDNN